MPAANASMSATQWILLLTLSLVWGGSYFFVGVAVDDLPPLTIVLCRVGLASIALLIFLACSGQSMPTDRRVWAAFFIMGLLNNAIPFSLIVWGQTHVSAGQAPILNATTPIFTVIAAHVFTRDEKMKWRHLAGIALGFAGVVVLMGAAFLDAFTSSLLAQTALLGAAALLLLPLVVLIDQPLQLAPPGLPSILAVLGLALISTAFAYVLYFRILASAGATNLSLVTMLVPPTAICLGILFLDEVLARHHLVGLVLIISGLLVIDGRLAAFRRDKG